MNCPKCNKPMIEQPVFPGLWLCPDYVKPINDRAPYKFKCTGMRLTEAGERSFTEEVNKIIARNN